MCVVHPYTCSKPDPKRICDLPGCFILDVNAEWHVFHGCSHSYHISCLGGNDHCPICRVHLKKVAEKLAKTAKGAYTKNTTNNITKKKDCDDLDVEAPNVCTMQEPTIEGGIQQLHRKIKHLEPLAPSVPTLPSMEINSSFIFLNEANKLPHCKSCQHARKGHTCSKQPKNVIQCQLCPDLIYSVLGRKVLCTCEWHSSNRANSLSQVYRGFTNSIQDSVVRELLLPSRASQAGLASGPINSCTVIATLTCMFAYKGNLACENIVSDHVSLARHYCNVMKIGNLR